MRRTAAVTDGIVTVSAVEATAPSGVTVAGEKLHEAPSGSPEQLNETAEAKPFSGITETVVVPLYPSIMSSEAGYIATAKLRAGKSIVYAAAPSALIEGVASFVLEGL